MHASPMVPLLRRWLRRACPAVHAARTTAVVTVVEASVLGAKLALTDLGRNLRSAAFAKHSIKRVDRLLGNRHLHEERSLIYRAVAHWLLAATPRPVLLIDWADCGPGHRWLMLRAAVPLGGRAVPIYEEVHPLRRYNSPRTHRRFLAHLRAVLPANCSPILLTDAGFRGPWFREVERFGWEWVGRVRNQVKYRLTGEADDGAWAPTQSLYPAATPRRRHHGRGTSGARSSVAASRTPANCTSCDSIAAARAGRARRTGGMPRRGAVGNYTRTRGCSRRRCRTPAARPGGWSSCTRCG